MSPLQQNVSSATQFLHMFSERLICQACWHNFVKLTFFFHHLIWFMPYWRWNLEIRISRHLLQNPKESHRALKDLKDIDTETLWIGFWLKNRKLNSCYQSYLSYYLLIFLIYQNIMLLKGHFYCTRPDNFCYNTKNTLNMGNQGLF